MTGLTLSTEWKNDSYDSILVIVDWLTKMVHYKPVKITINALEPVEVIIDMVIQYYLLPDFIISDRRVIFMSRFWSLLCYFLGVKRQLSNAFHPSTDKKTEQQNSKIKAYLHTFVNWEQNDQARPLLMAEFVYNKSKNASTSHTPFELNYGYHPCVCLKDKV